MDPQLQTLSQILSEQDMEQMLVTLGVSDLSAEEKQQVVDTVAGVLVKRVIERIAGVLTKEDITRFQEVDSKDVTGESGKQFLLSKVPNFEAILAEELLLFKEDITGKTSSL